MSKMDDYYKKQLLDHQPADDGWNIPSDDLWNKAQPHFPKPKKKRRFLFLLFPIGIFLLIMAGYYLGKSTRTDSIATEPSYATSSNTLKNTTNTEKNIVEVSTESSKDLSSPPNQSFSNHTTNSNKTHSSTTPNGIKSTSSSKEKTAHIIDLESINSSLTDNQAVYKASNRTINKDLNNTSNYTTTHPPFLENRQTTSVVGALNYFSSSQKKNTRLTNVDKQIKQIQTLATLKTLTTKPLDIQDRALAQQDLSINIADNEKPTSRHLIHEVGTGSMLHLLTIVGEVENDANEEWQDEKIILKSYNNVNLNLHYNRYLSKKWNLSTGLYYHSMNFDLDGTIYDILSESNIDDFVSSNLSDRLNDGLTENRQSDDFMIELLDGETVNAGDTLKFGLDISLNLKTIQLPILINREWSWKRISFFVGAGASFDIQSWRQRSADIQLYRDDRLITKPYSEGETGPERRYTYGLIVQSGLNYKITDNLKFGVSGRVVFPDLITTGIEARFLYRL